MELQKQYLKNQEQKIVQEVISYTDREIAHHASWCNANGIKIYFAPIDDYKGRIVIETNGKGVLGEHVYKNWRSKLGKDDIHWSEMIKRLYTYKYLKLGGVSQKSVEVELEVYLRKFKKNKKTT